MHKWKNISFKIVIKPEDIKNAKKVNLGELLAKEVAEFDKAIVDGFKKQLFPEGFEEE